MYAIISTGGKQYPVSVDQCLKVESLEAEPGETVHFDVLLFSNGSDIQVGKPLVAGKKVSAEVLAHGRGEKVKIIKFRRRKHHMKQRGHRQRYTEVKIIGIK